MHPPDSPPPEHWETDAGDASVALLDIPPDALRERSFEVFCSLSVARVGPGSGEDDTAWHQLQVLVNGAHEWQRREATHEGSRDSLDYRFRRRVPAGQPLRVSVASTLHRARRLSLRVTADED